MRVFRNDNGFDTVCRREAKTRAAADTHTYTKDTIIVIIPKKRAVARQLVFYITILVYTDFIPNHFSATMAKEKNGHPSDTRNIMSLNAYRQTIFLP